METIGVVLAGGRSSRMGQDKCWLDFQDKPLVLHMSELLLSSGVAEVVISGQAVPGMRSIPDRTPYQGPAQAMLNLFAECPLAQRFLFVPVDMPLLEVETFKNLLSASQSAYFAESYLPCLLYRNDLKSVDSDISSVKEVLEHMGAQAFPRPDNAAHQFVNTNTPEQFAQVINT